MFNKKDLPMYIIEPHKNKSRKATNKDAEYIAKQASEMMLLAAKIEQTRKHFTDAYAIHHSQVCKKPINFFVINPTNQLIFEKYEDRAHFTMINAEIIKHTKHTVTKKEGCLSFPGYTNDNVERWNKIVIRFQYLVKQDDNSFLLSEPTEENLSGLLAQMVQHELDHANAKYIWEI